MLFLGKLSERLEDDSLEIMSRNGMGMCYTHLDNGELMRNVDPDLRERIKTDYNIPHQGALETMTTELLHKYGHVTVIDCHSFPDIPLNRDLNQDMPRPDFCLGTDEFHTPKELYLPVQELLTNLGYSVLINNPYSGTMIPLKYDQKNQDVHDLMIEVNRRLYMTSVDGEIIKTAGFEKIKKIIMKILPSL